ncbi:TetR/AcrR family transcriptional regulator [Microlunatus parietis]|uniref:AcrR family transcriptional regulator n=1 Tax=Microlunatus parietis TaxID=682979 RepID=A0A7Y9LDV2_9ACTN|nr:TetR/AcrR family transcriptional regulator [Microlunatus parietis]NYE72361.1 AcrR family transcriptional regulator [Microlunatus parietis]
MSARRTTFTEQARRAQLVEVTIDLVARHGYAGTSLQRIADAAGITKAAVIYHFASKNAVIKAAYDFVIARVVEHVGARVDAAPDPAAAVEAYLTGMIDYVAAHPAQARLLTETMIESGANEAAGNPDPSAKNATLATLIKSAQRSGGYRKDLDPDWLAVILGGAADGIAARFLTDDPAPDPAAATDELLALLRHGATAP